MRRLLLAAIAMTAVASAQEIVSAKAGLIHLMEGKVLINGAEAEQKGDQFLSLKESEVLATERGRAEVLLNAGTYLRVGENSSFRLASTDLEDTKVTVLSGTTLIEVSELPKDTLVTVEILGSQAQLKKRGLYEFTATAPGKVRVYDGELALKSEGSLPIPLQKGREIAFNALIGGPVKFDQAVTTALYRWGARRARYIAQANASAASSLLSNQAMYTLLGAYGPSYGYNGVWAWNPMFGMYTYLPIRGYGYSPFGGIVLYSPISYWQQYAAPVVMNTSSAFADSGPRSAVSSAGYASAGSVSSAPALPAATAPAVATPNVGGGDSGAAAHRR
ncbi:MAG: hypothetical protein RL328_1397 [Acidobacteriota bacterium]|jgi:hypothetical protein